MPATRRWSESFGRPGDAGVTLVPLSLYFQVGWAKVEIALARGRRSFGKRRAIAQRDADREIARELSDSATWPAAADQQAEPRGQAATRTVSPGAKQGR